MPTSLTVQTITNWFLFGQETTPESKHSDQFIRPDDASAGASVDINEYMAAGGGRFANPPMFDLVSLFFTDNNHIMPGFYSKDDLAEFYNLSYYGLIIEQRQFADSIDDYNEKSIHIQHWRIQDIR